MFVLRNTRLFLIFLQLQAVVIEIETHCINKPSSQNLPCLPNGQAHETVKPLDWHDEPAEHGL